MELQLEPKFNALSRIYNHSEVIIVGILVAFYLFLSNYFYWSATFVYGGGIAALPTSGGSDPYYNFIAILHILNQHTQLVYDPTLNYPLGTINPRNPFFHWFIALVAEILSPFYGAQTAAFYAFEEFDAVFGALLIIPVYLITREIFGKNAAAVGALLYALMPSNLSAGILSGGRMHTPELIFAFFSVYFFLRAIRLSGKNRIIDNLRDFRHYPLKIYEFYQSNKIPTIYGLLAGASLGGLMLSWQGYAYIEAILLLYVAVQLIVNLIFKRPTGYITYYTALFVILGFLMGFYYYAGVNELTGWYNAELEIGILIVLFGVLIGLVGRRPWILIIPILVLAVIAGLEGMAHFSPALLDRLLSGDGYFIKTRVYSTIAEAAAPALGSYIGGFGIAQFLLGMVGVGYAAYLFLKEKTDQLLLILVFSVVSIYMSFAAARFNITAAPAYAILGAGVLLMFAKISKIEEVKKKKPTTSGSAFKAIKGNIKWLQAAFVIIVTLLVIVPSATSMISASVPAGSPAQAQVESQIANSLPAFLKTNNTTNFVGGLSGGVSNGSTPLSKSFAWLSGQDSNVPVQDRAAYLSWWDYGFQERYQGQHPTVADDFQQGIATAGQVLLAQNNSQIISLFIGRVLQGAYSNGDFSAPVKASLIQYLGYNEYVNLSKVSANPSAFTNVVLDHPSIYGQYITEVSSANVYNAFVKGQLASKYSDSTLVNLYQVLMSETGYSIKYIQAPTDNSVATLLPTSAQNTGIFYAPAYLTDSPSYTSSGGGVIPTEYYNIYATTANGTFSLQNLPSGIIPTAYNIQFTPAFYNTSIYRFTVGLPPSAVGQSNGIPGVTYGSTQYSARPAWDMSNFMVIYENIPFNPYKDYAAHESAWTTIPLSQAYYNAQHGIGTVELTPPVTTSLAISDPIVAYYPGAIIHGRVTMPNGDPAPGVNVTLFDQYGIPHQVVSTNSQGYYNITGLPGNDTLYYSLGSTNNEYLIGSTTLGQNAVHVTNDQANRLATSYNQTTALPDYYIQKNLEIKNTTVSGTTSFQYQQRFYGQNTTEPLVFTKEIRSGSITFNNSQYNISYTTPIVGGNYTINNLPPVSYQVSITTGGHTYSNFQYANVTNGGNLVYDLAIPLDTIFANVTVAGSPVSGVGVSATTNDGYVVGTTSTNSTGTAEIWVTPGNYNVIATGDNISSYSYLASFQDWNTNTSVQVTPDLSAKVTIGVNDYTHGTNVILYANGIISNAAKLDFSNGKFTGTVPYGVYTIYATNGAMSYLKTVVLNGSYTSDISLVPSANLTILSHLSATNKYSGTYEILNGTAMLSYDFTADHAFSMSIPEGAYTITGIGTFTGGTSSAYQTVNLYRNQTYNLSLTSNYTLSALLYNKDSATGYNANSALSTGIVVLKYGGYPVYYNPVSTSGLARLYYPGGSNSLLTMSFMGAYYSGSTVSVNTQQVSIPVTPVKKTMTVSLNSTPLSTPLQTLTLTSATGSYNFTLVHGNGSIVVPIGLYSASLNQSGIKSTIVPEIIPIETVSPSSSELTLAQYVNISINNANLAQLLYQNGTPVNGFSDVKTGTYTLYAYNSSQGVNLSEVNIFSDKSITPTYTAYYDLNISNSLGISSGTYSIYNGKTTINITNGNIKLPAGTYTINYLKKTSNTTGSFTYTGSKTFSLNNNMAVTVPISMTKNYAEVSGNISYNNAPVMNTYLEYVNSNGNVVATGLTNSSGGYRISSPTGLYTVYAVKNASKLAYLGVIDIPAFATTDYQNLTLKAGYAVSFSVNIASQTINNPVNITSGNAQLTVQSGSSSIILPNGGYQFTSTISKTQQTSDGNYLTVSYSSSVNSQISSDQVIPLTLSKVVVHSFQVKLLSSVAEVGTGGNLTYIFTLTNNGNSNETISLETGSSIWKENFSGGSSLLMPIGNTSTITLNATLQGKLEYGSNAIPFIVKYSGGSSTLSLPVNIAKNSTYTIGQGKATAYENGSVLIPVVLNNTGNAPITVNLSLNKTYLKDSGWSAAFSGTVSYNDTVSLPYNASVTVYVVLTPTVANPVHSLSFTVYSTSPGITGKSAPLTLVSSPTASITPYPTGPLITSNYTGTPTESLISGIVVIVVAVVAGLGIAAYRGRRN